MEVLVLNDFCSINGGAAYVAITSARELAERGHQVTFFGPVGPVAKELDHPNIQVICLDQKDILRNPNRFDAVIQGVYNRKVVEAFGALLDKKDPVRTVIHIHGFIKALSPYVIKLALDRGFRVAHTLHDYSITCPNGGFLVYPTETVCHRTPLSASCILCNCDSRNYGHKLWRVGRIAVQNKFWSIDKRLRFGIFPSQLTKRILEPYLPNLKISRLVLYPVHTSKNPPAEPGRHDTIAFIGRFSREKGTLLLAEAAKRAKVPVVFIGSGDEGLQKAVKEIYPEAELAGWLPQAAITERLRQCRALVMPSLWYETLGLVAIEAMSQGLPVIIPDHCAAIDYVQNGVTGLFFKQANVEDLCAQIERLKDPALANSLGRAAYDWYWNDPWTVKRHVDGLQQFYDDVLAS